MYFFQQYLAALVVLALYLFWKVYSRNWRLLVPIHEIDLMAGARLHSVTENEDDELKKQSWFKRIARGLF